MTTPQSFVQTLDEKLSQAAAAQLRQAGTEAEVATPVTPTVPTGSVLVRMQQGDYV